VTAQRVCSTGGIVKNAGPDPQQQLPFFTQPTNSQVSSQHRQVKPYSKRYLQDILWKESLLAVQVSMDCQTIAELVARLPEKLPQNSAVTRQRNTSTIVSRFFPVEEIDQLPRQILRLYEDEDLLAAVMQVLFLEAEPLVGQLVAERLTRLPAGTALPKDFFVQYTLEALGKREPHVSYRCCTAARVLGWTIVDKKRYYVAQQNPNETAALLILHYRYAPTPQVIDLKAVLAEPTWKYLGFSDEDAVRSFMRKLERRKLIARYATADRLEQVTTRYALESLLERKARL
jgi:hypothetical protein